MEKPIGSCFRVISGKSKILLDRRKQSPVTDSYFLVRSYKSVPIPSNNSPAFLRQAAISPLCLAPNSPAPGLLLSLSQHFPSDRHLSATSPHLYSNPPAPFGYKLITLISIFDSLDHTKLFQAASLEETMPHLQHLFKWLVTAQE